MHVNEPHVTSVTHRWPRLFHVTLFEVVSCYHWYKLMKTHNINLLNAKTSKLKNTSRHPVIIPDEKRSLR